MDQPPLQTFFLFSRLPYELQDAIWETSLPCRLVNYNRPAPLTWKSINDYKTATDGRPMWPTPAPWVLDGAAVAPARGERAIPSIAHVCRHARAVAMRHGAWMRCPRFSARKPAWFDRRATVLIEDKAALDLMLPTLYTPDPDSYHIDSYLIGNLNRTAGGLAIASVLLTDAKRRSLLFRLLALRYCNTGPGTGYVRPLLVYTDEIVLRGPRAVAVAAAQADLFHIGSGAGTASTAGRLRCWRLVPLADVAMLRRMLAFCQSMVRAKRARRRKTSRPAREDPNVAFFQSLLQPDHLCQTLLRIDGFFETDPPPGYPYSTPQFDPAVLVWFISDDEQKA